MPFIKKTKSGYQVRKGDTGELLKSFSGKDAKMNADKEVKRLQKKNKPLSKNRGASARKKHSKK